MGGNRTSPWASAPCPQTRTGSQTTTTPQNSNNQRLWTAPHRLLQSLHYLSINVTALEQEPGTLRESLRQCRRVGEGHYHLTEYHGPQRPEQAGCLHARPPGSINPLRRLFKASPVLCPTRLRNPAHGVLAEPERQNCSSHTPVLAEVRIPLRHGPSHVPHAPKQ